MTGNSTTMGRTMSLLARLVATHALLFGAAMMNTGLAQESTLAPNQSEAKVYQLKKPKISRPSTDVRNSHGTATPSPTAEVVRNAIGQPIRGRQLSPGSDGRLFTPSPANPVGKSATIAPGIGPASVSGPDFHHQASVSATISRTGTNDLRLTAPMNHSSINGTAMMRPGSGTSTIGGASNKVIGGINGTGFRPKHP
jgi:hypothetical protein